MPETKTQLEEQLQSLPDLLKSSDIARFFNYKQNLSARQFIKRNLAALQPLTINGTYFIERQRFAEFVLSSRKSS